MQEKTLSKSESKEGLQSGAIKPHKNERKARAMNTYELVIIWEDNEKQIYEYDTAEEAQKGADNMVMAFGRQIQFTCVRRKVQA